MESPRASESGKAWTSEEAASGWQRGSAARGEALRHVTDLMLDLAGVSVGGRVLDIGTGTGDQALVAAQRVGPKGSVLATDLSPSMLELAREAARSGGIENVETRQMDAQRLELDGASFDAVFARYSLQFVPDLHRALTEIRRVLKPGGKFAAVVFSSIESNLFRAAPQVIASRLAGLPFPEPGPGQWALNDPATLTDALQQAGFRDIGVRTVAFMYHFASLADALRNVNEAQPLFTKIMNQLSEADRARAWAEIEQTFQPLVGPDGFNGPGEALIVSGTA